MEAHSHKVKSQRHLPGDYAPENRDLERRKSQRGTTLPRPQRLNLEAHTPSRGGGKAESSKSSRGRQEGQQQGGEKGKGQNREKGRERAEAGGGKRKGGEKGRKGKEEGEGRKERELARIGDPAELGFPAFGYRV